jgi:hypothetical protein
MPLRNKKFYAFISIHVLKVDDEEEETAEEGEDFGQVAPNVIELDPCGDGTGAAKCRHTLVKPESWIRIPEKKGRSTLVTVAMNTGTSEGMSSLVELALLNSDCVANNSALMAASSFTICLVSGWCLGGTAVAWRGYGY